MLRRLLSILSVVVALVGFTALKNAQETGFGGWIGFAGSFTMTNAPAQGNPPPPAASPSFGSEIFSYNTGSTNSPPGKCSITANVAVGQRIVVIAMIDGNDYHVSAVTDSKGNSYSQMINYNNTNFQNCIQTIWSAYATGALTAGTDTITITWSPSTTGWRAYAIGIVTLNNTQSTGQPDSTAENNAYMYTTAVSVPGTTVAANTVSVGLVAANNFAWSIRTGTIYDKKVSNIQYLFFYHVNTSAGVYNPRGTGPAHNTYSGIWAAFK